MNVAFGSKAQTLERLSDHVRHAAVLPCFYFLAARWPKERAKLIAGIRAAFGAKAELIVRSSAAGEDAAESSQAGRYTSVAAVRGTAALERAVETVIASYGDGNARDEILVQPMLRGIAMAGVALSRDPGSAAPYLIVNYEEGGEEAADAVTGGRSGNLKTFVCAKPCSRAAAEPSCTDRLARVAALVDELETLTGSDRVDIEFAFAGDDDTLYLLQARPLVLKSDAAPSAASHSKLLDEIAAKIAALGGQHPFLHGRRAVYGVMPDWNPAEIIGVRPKPLALSLYRELVTDSIWAYQRDNYGYKNLRSFPLMVHFHGLPYIDVRVSFNSFVPAEIEGALADRLVDYYIGKLVDAPTLHDKVEFEIVYSCYTLDLPQRLDALAAEGFSAEDRRTLEDSLRRLTNRIIHRDSGLWRTDRDKLDVLEARRKQIYSARLDKPSRIYWLLEDCKRYGTLPFAGLARAGFIAVQMLRSLVTVGVLSWQDYDRFMSGLNTVSRQMADDLASLDRATFLAKYGHLRPGTYDILSPRYDEAPDLYFDWSRRSRAPAAEHVPFALSLSQMRDIARLLTEHGLDYDVVGLFDFLQAGIELREYAKFVFTRNLSDALSLFREYGEECGFSLEDMAYADIRIISEIHGASVDARALLARSIEEGRERHGQTLQLILPPLITDPDDVRAFHLPSTQPNFITQRAVTGPVLREPDRNHMKGRIVCIPNADPGFDWIFAHGIGGFITAYGGVNSHMAIRANELGLPAVVGAGEALFEKWSIAEVLRIDCANRRVECLR